MKLLIHSQISTAKQSKYGLVIESYTLRDMWLLIHAGIKANGPTESYSAIQPETWEDIVVGCQRFQHLNLIQYTPALAPLVLKLE